MLASNKNSGCYTYNWHVLTEIFQSNAWWQKCERFYHVTFQNLPNCYYLNFGYTSHLKLPLVCVQPGACQLLLFMFVCVQIW